MLIFFHLLSLKGEMQLLFVFFLVISLLCAAHVRAGFGIDFIDPASVGQMQCLLNAGQFFSTRVYHDGGGGGCDATGGANIEAAYTAGFHAGGGVMPYIFPNPPSMVSGRIPPSTQVQASLWCTTAAGFPHGGIYWLDIELDPYNPWPDCGTSTDYILEMMAELWKYGPTVGVYSSAYEWQTVTCQTDTTPEGRNLTASFTARLHAAATASAKIREEKMKSMNYPPSNDTISRMIASNETFRSMYTNSVGDGANQFLLWYAHYDGIPSFSDFSPFGPFKSPFAKQYNDNCDTCGLNSDCDWSPI